MQSKNDPNGIRFILRLNQWHTLRLHIKHYILYQGFENNNIIDFFFKMLFHTQETYGSVVRAPGRIPEGAGSCPAKFKFLYVLKISI